jgi:hypothetical protein
MSNKKAKIIEFPSKAKISTSAAIKKDDKDYEDFEDEDYFYFLEEEDYEGLLL